MHTQIKTPLLKLSLSAGLFICSLNMVHADSVYWSGGTGTWSESANWDTDIPQPADSAYLDKGGETQLNDSQTVTYLQAGRQYAAAGSLVIQNGGVLNVTGAAGSAGAINLSPVNTNGFGQITIESGGSLNVTQGTVFIGRKGEGLITQTGGTFNVGENLQIGRDADSIGGTYSISNGKLEVNQDFTVTSNATAGRFEITGNWAGANNISIGGNLNMNTAIATLAYNFGAAGIEQITVAGSANLSNATLEFGFADGFSGASGTYDLLTATTITSTGLTLDDQLTGGFSIQGWEVISGGNGQVLQVTVIPEPSSYALIGGLATLGTIFFFRARKSA